MCEMPTIGPGDSCSIVGECIAELSTTEDGGLAELPDNQPPVCPTDSHAHDSPRAFSECTNIEG